MYIIVDKVLKFMKENNMSEKQFAEELGISIGELRKMLSGERTSYDVASKFIYYFTADVVQDLIDWERLGIVNPLKK